MAAESLSDGLGETLSIFDGSGEPLTTSEVAGRLDVGRRSTYDRLERLVEREYLDTKKVGASARVWWRPGNAEPGIQTDDEADDCPDSSLFEQVLDASPAGIGVFDTDGEPLWLNQQFVELIGWSELDPDARALGEQSLLDEDGAVIPYRDRPVPRALATGDPVTNQRVRVDSPDDRARWLSVNAVPLSDDTAGDVVVTMDDVTRLTAQARRLERQRDEARAELDETFERIDDAFYALDDEWRFTYANEVAGELFEVDESKIVGEDAREVIDYTEPFVAALEEAYEHQESVYIEDYYPPLERWFENTIYPSENGLSVYFREFTERKQHERELELYETIIETIEDGVYVLDEDYRFVEVNDAYVEMTGYDREELLGAHCSLVVDEEVSVESAERLEEIVEEDSSSGVIEADIHRADGTTLRAESKFTALQPGDRTPPRKVGVVRDVSQRLERKRELERRVAQLEGVTSLGQFALANADVESLLAEAVDLVAAILDTDYCKVLDLDADADELLLREGVGWPDEVVGSTTVSAVEADSQAAYTLDIGEPVVMPDLATESRFSAPDLLRDHDVRSGISTVVGSADDPWGILGAHDTDRRAFSDHDVYFVRSVATILANAIERAAHERKLEESERRLRTLVDNFPNGGVALFDEDLTYTVFGGEILDERGQTAADVEGLTVREAIPTDLATVLEPAYRAAFEGESSQFEIDRDESTTQLRVTPVRDQNGEIFAGLGMSQDITQRVEYERELETQREQLAALNDLHGVVRDITTAVIEQSTREEIEETVCERLAAMDSYQCAWIGDVDTRSQEVRLRAEAGVTGFLDGVTVSVAPDDVHSNGPTGRALLEGETQITRDAQTDPSHDPWRENVEEYGVRSVAAIPISHDGTVYGALNVLSGRANAFGGDVRPVISRIGEIVGHAIASVERKQALLSDEVVELGFRVSDLLGTLGLPATAEGEILIDQTVSVGDGVFLEYGTATGDAFEVVEALVATDTLSQWESVTVLGRDGDQTRFEVRLVDPPMITAVAANNGHVQEAGIENGDYYMTVHLSPTVDASRLVQAVLDAYPDQDLDLELVTRRQITRRDPSERRVERTVASELTDRQRAALEAAFFSGYFDSPRVANGGDVADSLGVSAPTFHHHLRRAQRTLLATVLED